MMLLHFLVFMLAQSPAPTQPDAASLKQLAADVQQALDAFCEHSRKLNGIVSVYRVDKESKKLLQQTVIKTDALRRLTIDYNGDKQFSHAELYREYPQGRQLLILNYDRGNKGPRLQIETYAQKGEAFEFYEDYEYEKNRVFAYDFPTNNALRPVPQVKWTFADLLEYPAFKITSLESSGRDKDRVVKVSFTVDQAINAKQTLENQLSQLQHGWFEFRPSQFWTVYRAEYALADARKAIQTWQVAFHYEPSQAAIPLLRQIQMAPLTQKGQVEPVSRVIDCQFELVSKTLPDSVFSLEQFGLPERTIEAGLQDKADRKKREESDKLNPPPPAGGFPIAKHGIDWTLWSWLIATGIVVFVAMGLLLSKRKPKDTSTKI